MADLIGQSFGRYHILEQLGEGGMAVVYKAFDTQLERNVAVKVITPSREHSDKFLKRFRQEAKALAKLSHPNIVGVIDYGEQEGIPYLVMEYVSGGTLKQKLAGKHISWQEAVKILVPIARALGQAHEQGIIHRDVKPSNILITSSGEPMLSDFGIAKILESEETMDLTGTGVGVGTPEYMSPEQAQGKPVDARSDIYSLGVVLYEMVTGRKPYQADTPMAVVWKLASEPLPRPKEIAEWIPDAIEQVLLKALAKELEYRYQNMSEFGNVLEQVYSKKLGSTSRTKVAIPGIASKLLLGTLIVVLISLAGWWIFKGRPILQTENDGTPTEFATGSMSNGEPAGYLITQGSTTQLNIVFMNADGTEFEPLFDLQGKNQVASLSPDGLKVAFASDSDGDNDIYIFDTAAGSVNKLVDTPTTEWNPVWSPDGSRLAMVSDFAGSFDVYIINADGTGMERITVDPLPEWAPSWSPNGKQIVFQHGDETSTRSDLSILNVETGDVTQLTNDQAFDGYPAWSPDGSKIAFASNLNGNLDIFVISPNGNERSVVSANQNNEATPAWSPKGDKLVFSMDMGGGNNDLFLVDLDGTGLTRLTNTPQNETEPVWMANMPKTLTNAEDVTYLIDEDFQDAKVQMYGFSADSDRWQIVDDDAGNKVFQVDNRDGTETSAFSFGADEWTDYTAEYRVKYLNDPAEVGLQVRSDGNDYYVMSLGISELYLAYPTPSEWIRITTKFPPIQAQNWHTVRVIVQSDTIQVLIDGARWIDENDSKYQNGWLLMFASPGTYAQVDDIQVWE